MGVLAMNSQSPGTRKNADALRGASRLAVQATQGVMGLVEEMHCTIASGPAVLGRPLERPARLFTGWLYGALQGVTRQVGMGLDAVLEQLAPWLGDSAPGPQREAVVSALNGVLGDALEEGATRSPSRCHSGAPGGCCVFRLTPFVTPCLELAAGCSCWSTARR